jgi:capsular exopolysaccharide synthesis family protein
MSEALDTPPASGPLVLGENGHELVPAPATIISHDPVRAYAFPIEEGVHFWDYWQVLFRHRWTVVSCFLVTVILTMIWTLTTRPVYTGTVVLRIEHDEPKVLKFEEVVRDFDSQQDYYQTQYKLLQSRTLANRVIGLLQLDQHPEFAQPENEGSLLARLETSARLQLVRFIPIPPPPAPQETEDLALESPLTNAVVARLTVEPVRGSRLVKLSFDSYHRDLAARVPNTAAESFIAQQLEQKVEATRYATQFLAKQLDDTRDRLGEAEKKLTQFLEANDILFVGGVGSAMPQDLISQQLTRLSDSFLKARDERIARESVMAQASGQNLESLPAVLQSATINQLKQDLASQEGEYKKLGQVFKPQYPRMQQLAQKLAETRRQLKAELARVVEGLQASYQTAARTEREMEAALVQQRMMARHLADRMADYNLLRRDVDTSRDLYAALLARLRETQIASALLLSNISIADRAEIPARPSRPNKSTNLLFACLVGLLGGVGLAFFFEYLDTSIKDANEVETVLRVPALGLVPSRTALQGRRHRRQRELVAADGQPFALISHLEIGSVFAEAFRNLRTSLLYSAPDHPPKTLIVTSLHPEDGKTSLITNLAITLAQLGAGEVLLVDADMRRPNVHKVLGIPQAPGLSTYLTGQAELGDVVVPTNIPNLLVIPSGRIPLNPAELLASARFRQALPVLRQRFAYVVFDTGPLFGVSDAMILATQVEGVVMVLRHGRATRDAAQRAIRNLLSVHARILGVILNDVNVSGNGHYGYYGYQSYYHDYSVRSGDEAAQEAEKRAVET